MRRSWEQHSCTIDVTEKAFESSHLRHQEQNILIEDKMQDSNSQRVHSNRKHSTYSISDNDLAYDIYPRLSLTSPPLQPRRHLPLTLDPIQAQNILLLHAILPKQLRRPRLLPLNNLHRVLPPLILILSHLLQMHLVGAIHNAHRPSMRPHVRQRRVLAHASSAVCLDCPVEDLQKGLRHEDLGLGDLLQGALGVHLVNGDGGVADDQARGVNVDARFGDALEHDAVLGEVAAERLLGGVVGAGEEVVEGFFGLT